MSLLEFFNDKSYGGSWADAEIDMASILVPISSLGYSTRSGSNFYGGNNDYGGMDSGPPYIVKLTHLPLTCEDSFIEDLFASRYTPFVKFKIIVDPSSNVLETGVIRKIAFVELQSNADLQKSLKWLDLYYKGNRRVAVELADFQDFQYCMDFNQKNHEEIASIERDFFEKKSLHRSGEFGERDAIQDPHRPPVRGGHDGRSFMNPYTQVPELGRADNRTAVTAEPPRPKPNPFGAAKPVDILSHQQEIEKRMKNLNSTTSITFGRGLKSPDPSLTAAKGKIDTDIAKETRRQSITILKRPQPSNSVPQTSGMDSPVIISDHKGSPQISLTGKDEPAQTKEARQPAIDLPKPVTATPKLVPPPTPPSVWVLSGASVLAAKPESPSEIGSRRNSPGNKKVITKPVAKPVVLKKKSAPVSPEPWIPIKSAEPVTAYSPAIPQNVPAEKTSKATETRNDTEVDAITTIENQIKADEGFEPEAAALGTEPFTSPFSQGEILTHTLEPETPTENITATSEQPINRSDIKKKFDELIKRPFVRKEKKLTGTPKTHRLSAVSIPKSVSNINKKLSLNSAGTTPSEPALSQSRDWRADKKSVNRSISPRMNETKPPRKAREVNPSIARVKTGNPSPTERPAPFKERAPLNAFQKKAKAKNSSENAGKPSKKSGLPNRVDLQKAPVNEGIEKPDASVETGKSSSTDTEQNWAAKEGPRVTARSYRGGRGSVSSRGSNSKSRGGRGGRQGTPKEE